MSFADHFSTQAAEYARHRPTYPPALFDFLAQTSPGLALAVDVGAGNGQVARPLARHFTRVIAVEPSAAQLEQAEPTPGVEFLEGPAEKLPVGDAGADLVTAGQAAHWFDLPAFYSEVRRISRPGALVAVFGYEVARITPRLEALVDELYSGVLGPYWPAQRRIIESGYRDIEFPFPELDCPPMAIERDWTATDFVNYVSTWSAVARYRQAGNADPLPSFSERLAGAWSGTVRVRWPLAIRLGAVHST